MQKQQLTLLGTTMDPAMVCTSLAKPTLDTVPNKQAAQANTFNDFILFTSLERLRFDTYDSTH